MKWFFLKNLELASNVSVGIESETLEGHSNSPTILSANEMEENYEASAG